MPPPVANAADRFKTRAGASRTERPLLRLMPVADALKALLSACTPMTPQVAAVNTATGRILAAPVILGHAVPRRSIALRAGFAVSAAAVVGASAYAPVFLQAPPKRVEVGEELPDGADAVLLPDALVEGPGLVEVVAGAAPGEGVRREGEDAAAGARLREAGDRLRAIDIPILGAAGIDTVVIREARVALIASPGTEAGADFVEGLVTAAGASVVRPDISRHPDLTVQLAESEGDLAVILANDAIRAAALDVFGAQGTLVARGLALRPGETMACGLLGGRIILVLPTRLESALAATLSLVLPCLDHLMAANDAPNAGFAGRLTRKIASSIGMAEIALLREVTDGLEPVAVGDLPLFALAQAQAWLAIPPESEGYPAGTWVRAAAI